MIGLKLTAMSSAWSHKNGDCLVIDAPNVVNTTKNKVDHTAVLTQNRKCGDLHIINTLLCYEIYIFNSIFGSI